MGKPFVIGNPSITTIELNIDLLEKAEEEEGGVYKNHTSQKVHKTVVKFNTPKIS